MLRLNKSISVLFVISIPMASMTVSIQTVMVMASATIMKFRSAPIPMIPAARLRISMATVSPIASIQTVMAMVLRTIRMHSPITPPNGPIWMVMALGTIAIRIVTAMALIMRRMSSRMTQLKAQTWTVTAQATTPIPTVMAMAFLMSRIVIPTMAHAHN